MRALVLIASGFGLKFVSKQIELMGDVSPAGSSRLGYHAIALVLLIAAIGCFITALVSIFSARRA
jgi:hypothetical protein